MFRHVVMFRWVDGTDDGHVRAVARGLDRLRAAIPQIRSYEHGPDAGVNSDTFDYVVVGDFDAVEDYVAYRDHPVHQEFIRDLIVGHVAERAAIQYEIGG